jgi:hypothetical protein
VLVFGSVVVAETTISLNPQPVAGADGC